MKRIITTLILAALALAVASWAGTDTGAALGSGRNVATASEVREAVNLAIVEWGTHPTDPLAANCVGAGDPSPCCTGAGVGATCLPCGGDDCCKAPATAAQCSAFAVSSVVPFISSSPNFGGLSFRVERQCIDDGDWICNPQFPPGSATGSTPASVLPGANVVADDVAQWLSNLAAN